MAGIGMFLIRITFIFMFTIIKWIIIALDFLGLLYGFIFLIIMDMRWLQYPIIKDNQAFIFFLLLFPLYWKIFNLIRDIYRKIRGYFHRKKLRKQGIMKDNREEVNVYEEKD